MSPLLTTVNLNRARSLLIGAIFLSSIGRATAHSPETAAHEPGHSGIASSKAVKAKEDLPNFHQVHPFLYRGGEPSPEGMKKIKEMGITTIFDLRNPGEKSFDEKKAAKELGIRYISMPMNSQAPTAKQINRLIGEIDKAKEKFLKSSDSAKIENRAKEQGAATSKPENSGNNSENGSQLDRSRKAADAVLVHCAHGSDRTGCMIGIWRVMRDGYSYETAYQEMRKYWFTPKFTNLSNAVKSAATSQRAQ